MSICTACAQVTPTIQLLRLHSEIDSLRTSAQLCPLCRMILEALEKAHLVTKAEEYRAHKDGKYELVNDTSITVSINNHQETLNQKAWILVISCGPLKRESFMNASKFHDAPTAWLGIYAEEDSAAAEAVMTRPLAGDASSEGVLRLMKKWISTCVSGHEKCQWGYMRKELDLAGPEDDEGARLKAKYSEDNVELPTRVIDVQAFEDGVSLVESASVGGRGSYIALSHVWGKIKHFKTEHATYDKRMTKIGLDELPRTFRDAVCITRELGIRYLWIDSLCIIQDSREDWAREASRMASVYMNAYVTLSATCAEDSNGGLFTDRSPPPSSVSLDYIDPLTSNKAGTWTIHNRNTNWTQNVRRSILATRAWTLQEKQLARRTLHFASDQVSFECNMGIEFETQRPSEKTGIQTVPFQFLYWALLAFRSNAIANEILLPQLVMQTWCKILEDYTTRNLTFQSDKLPALEGLANYVSDLTRDQYFFGLWKGSLNGGMLWRTAPYTATAERRGRVKDRAPSWSWASVDGRVYFAEFGSRVLEAHTSRVSDIIDVAPDGRLTVRGQMVKLQRGKLGLQGQWDWDQIVKFYKRMETMDVKTSMHADYEPVRSLDQRWFGFAALDKVSDVEDQQEQELTALLMRMMTRKDIDEVLLRTEEFLGSYLVLFIRSLGAGQAYERIGMGQVFLCDEYVDKAKETICIV